MTAFLEAMLHDLDGRFVVVWDGDPMHKGDPIHQLAAHFADRLCLEALLPWLKYDRLCNYAPRDAVELDGRIHTELAAAGNHQEFLKSLYHASELPIPRALFI
ncbi:hypothetical protein V5E97_25770 [Singulisphaera sp. Ch08]|uniref:Uncharacterized protein n=1 Tax=Singulisphaera sp. Ch08 TaxID=3120278 RepID=A0AAU7C9F4_9BACT